MSGREHTLWCLVYGENVPFDVVALPALGITELKAVIHEKIDTDHKPYKLDLWKVRYFQ